METTASLARRAAGSAEPRRGALLIVSAMEDLREDLLLLEVEARRHLEGS